MEKCKYCNGEGGWLVAEYDHEEIACGQRGEMCLGCDGTGYAPTPIDQPPPSRQNQRPEN